MSNEVWKFRVPGPSEEPWVEMPKGAQLLHVAAQDGVPFVWALVSPTERVVRRHVVTYATGQAIDGWPDYLGTFHIDWTVWHVFASSSEHPVVADTAQATTIPPDESNTLVPLSDPDSAAADD